MKHLLLIICLLAIPLSLIAQFSGRLSGAVVDATGSVIPNAEVNLYLSGGFKPLLSATTTAEGRYTFIGVRPATYDLTVEAAGFAKATLRGVVVDPGRETSVAQVTLELPTVTQSVEVAASPDTVQTGNAEISETITMNQVDKLPVLDNVQHHQPRVRFRSRRDIFAPFFVQRLRSLCAGQVGDSATLDRHSGRSLRNAGCARRSELPGTVAGDSRYCSPDLVIQCHSGLRRSGSECVTSTCG
jgi:hypothetical protein